VTAIRPQRARAGQVRDALAVAARAGPFFRLDLPSTGAGWRSAADLDAGRLVSGTAAQLGTSELRVAASILHLAFAARLWSPILGCGLLSGVVPDLGGLRVRSELPLRLGLAEPEGWLADSAAELVSLSAGVVAHQLDGFAAGLPVPLPDGLLRGNSASAMAGALGVLVRADADLAGTASDLARSLLRTPSLSDAGVLAEAGAGPHPFPSFRRRSCCLYYRVPGGGLCEDCCLDRGPAV
jgi:FhuF 2Fe-2S C-terminal domain